ncbi:galactosylceramide sulfotransferase-like [Antedon mediterranea]|uniref:galactosylceramide sulfotransferase-like n=1 Tax=Antedon mediterranea TaxID=105859 RepID=UPI003AF86E9D
MTRVFMTGGSLIIVFLIIASFMYSYSVINDSKKPILPSRPILSSNTTNKQCSPATRIVFLKTHKTGGSTVSSILARYAYKWNLKMPRYKSTTNRIAFNRDMMKSQSNLKILASHTIYNKPEMNFVFGNAIYITILREPSAQFESSFVFFEMAKELNIEHFENPIEEFMRVPNKYMRTPGFKQSLKTQNDQFRLLALPKSRYADKSFIQYKLKQLEFEFDLVLMNEYFDESLILLRKLLCWQFKDMLYISKKIRNKRTMMSRQLREKIRAWNSADVTLYNYFNQTFWRKVSEYGDSFSADLEHFIELKKETTEKCIGGYSDGLLRSPQIRQYLTPRENQFCANLIKDATVFMKLMDSKINTDILESLFLA